MGVKHYGTEIDIWSVGCILIELLTRKIAFQVNYFIILYNIEILYYEQKATYLQLSSKIYSL